MHKTTALPLRELVSQRNSATILASIDDCTANEPCCKHFASEIRASAGRPRFIGGAVVNKNQNSMNIVLATAAATRVFQASASGAGDGTAEFCHQKCVSTWRRQIGRLQRSRGSWPDDSRHFRHRPVAAVAVLAGKHLGCFGIVDDLILAAAPLSGVIVNTVFQTTVTASGNLSFKRQSKITERMFGHDMPNSTVTWVEVDRAVDNLPAGGHGFAIHRGPVLQRRNLSRP